MDDDAIEIGNLFGRAKAAIGADVTDKRNIAEEISPMRNDDMKRLAEELYSAAADCLIKETPEETLRAMCSCGGSYIATDRGPVTDRRKLSRKISPSCNAEYCQWCRTLFVAGQMRYPIVGDDWPPRIVSVCMDCFKAAPQNNTTNLARYERQCGGCGEPILTVINARKGQWGTCSNRCYQRVYPEWWDGRRFDKPIRAWAAGVTGETVRDVVQEKLIGPPMRKSDWGTGFIPKHLLGEVSVARGIADLIDSVSVKHISGGNSDLQFKSYAAGREKWQGVGLEVVWMDEESPADLYFEALTRTNETRGIVYITFTPILGWSEVVRRFLTGET